MHGRLQRRALHAMRDRQGGVRRVVVLVRNEVGELSQQAAAHKCVSGGARLARKAMLHLQRDEAGRVYAHVGRVSVVRPQNG